MSAGTFITLPDLIVFCILFDVYVYREYKAGSVAVRTCFVYLARRDGEKPIILTPRHVSLEHLNRTCAAFLNQFATAAASQARLNRSDSMPPQTVVLPQRPHAAIRRAAHRGILYLYLFDDNSLSIQINTETLYISCPPMPNLDGHTVQRFAHVLLAALHDAEKLLQQRL